MFKKTALFLKDGFPNGDDNDNDDDDNDDNDNGDDNDNDDDDDDDNDNGNDNDDDDNRDDNGISTLAQLLWHWQWMVFIFSGPELSCHREEKQKETLNPIRQWGVP